MLVWQCAEFESSTFLYHTLGFQGLLGNVMASEYAHRSMVIIDADVDIEANIHVNVEVTVNVHGNVDVGVVPSRRRDVIVGGSSRAWLDMCTTPKCNSNSEPHDDLVSKRK